MQKLFFTDLEWTILKKWEIPQDNISLLDSLKENGIKTIISTWKWFLRVHPYFKNNGTYAMILENWAKTLLDWEIIEKAFDKTNQEKLLDLIKEIKNNIIFSFFYDSNNENKAYFYVWEEWIPKKYKEKFGNIINENSIFPLKDFEKNISKHKVSLLNIKTNLFSLDEIKSTDKTWLDLVFNEWILCVTLLWTNKWSAVENILNIFKNEKDIKILVAWNGKNDLPMMEVAIKLAKRIDVEVWILIVWNSLQKQVEKYKQNKNIKLLQSDTPENSHIQIKQFFTL